MEATTMERGVAPPVGFGGAFARQFRFLWTSRRPLLLAVALLAVLVLSGEPWTNHAMMRLLTPWPIWVVLVPVVWGFAVFHNEGPSGRFYFWSQPTGRSEHTLARIAAGLAWLWLMYALLIVAGWVLGVVDGDAWQMGEIGISGWVNFFTGPLIAYLAISVLTIPSDYPIRWFVGIIFVFPLLVSLFVEWLDMEDLVMRVLEPLANEDWGLGITMVGGLVGDIERLELQLRAMQDPSFTATAQFDAAQAWWAAMPSWTLVLVAVVVFIATRHPDRLPKWRGIRR